MDRFVIIDGHSQIYRALYTPATAAFRSPNGELIGGVYTFFRMFLPLLRRLDPSYLVMALDGPRDQLVRRKQFDGYKRGRSSISEDFVHQIEYIYQLCELLGVPLLRAKGWEADDVIATLVEVCHSEEIETIIISRDKDLHQTLRPGVRMYDPASASWTDVAVAERKWGVPISKIVDVQCLAGDTTDSIPGVKGVAVRTAAKLISQYGTAETVKRQSFELTPALQAAVRAFDLEQGFALVRMRTDLPLDIEQERLEWNGVRLENAKPLFCQLGLRKVVSASVDSRHMATSSY